jgi:hypothetical protein
MCVTVAASSWQALVSTCHYVCTESREALMTNPEHASERDVDSREGISTESCSGTMYL